MLKAPTKPDHFCSYFCSCFCKSKGHIKTKAVVNSPLHTMFYLKAQIPIFKQCLLLFANRGNRTPDPALARPYFTPKLCSLAITL